MIQIISKTLRMPRELSENLKQISKEQGLTLNALILQILWQWIDQKIKI